MRNVSYSLRHLNTWSPIGDAVCGDLGNTGLLEEVCSWEQAFLYLQLALSMLPKQCELENSVLTVWGSWGTQKHKGVLSSSNLGGGTSEFPVLIMINSLGWLVAVGGRGDIPLSMPLPSSLNPTDSCTF